METGKIVVPTFQRGFVWPKSQVLNLLRSIYQGYPIGTIIVFEQLSKHLEMLTAEEALFPDSESQSRSHPYVWSVVDGAQRLAAIYNSFFAKEPKVNVFFDLETEEFLVIPKSKKSGKYIHLHALYSTEEFFQFQRLVFAHNNRDMLLDRVTNLHRAFKDYQIPIQVLVDVSFDDAASIFQQLNVSGQRLSKSEIQKAMNRKNKARKKTS